MPDMIENGIYKTNVQIRHARGNRSQIFYFSSLVIAMVVLITLLLTVLNQAFGLVAVSVAVQPEELSEQPLSELNSDELATIIAENAGNVLLRVVHQELSPMSELRDMSGVPLSESLEAGAELPEGWAERAINELSNDERAQLLALNLSEDRLIEIINEEIIVETVEDAWFVLESVTEREAIERRVEDAYPNAELRWRSWLTVDFLTSRLNPTDPSTTGIAPAIYGSIWIMLIVIFVSFPLGVGAAIYLEEYADDSWYNRIIESNIRNLAGVPSIIYGMLGLAVFVRALFVFSSGQMFGTEGERGNTVIAAALTLALLILPIIIISTQEALRSVPSAYREASYGLGATKWQTIWRQILPSALPGILTGTIIAISRAVGETAPLIVVGAATFLSSNPDGPFAAFTALPIMIYNWTAQPDPQFRNAAAAGIIVLLVVMLTLNATAIYLRNRLATRN